MSDTVKRVALGFHAAPPLALRLTEQALKDLRSSLEKGDWIVVEAEDASVTVNTSQVLYLRVEKDEQRVGFGLGGG